MVDESLGESEGVSNLGNNREKVPRRAVLLSVRRSCFPSIVRFILKSGVGEAAKGHMFKDQLFTGSAQYTFLWPMYVPKYGNVRRTTTASICFSHCYTVPCQRLDAAGRPLSGDYFPQVVWLLDEHQGISCSGKK
ncbi:unnamed protein product [Ectocarpus sp. 8 AP-2014]